MSEQTHHFQPARRQTQAISQGRHVFFRRENAKVTASIAPSVAGGAEVVGV